MGGSGAGAVTARARSGGRGHRLGVVAALVGGDLGGWRRGSPDLAHEQDRHGHQVGEPDDDLEHGHRGRDVEHALEDGPDDTRRRDRRGDVEGEVVDAGQDPRLLEVVDAVGEHAGRDHDQDQSGPGEEHPQVELERSTEERPRDHERGPEAEQGADERPDGRLGRLRVRPQEQRGLEALATDGEHRDDEDRACAGGDRPVELRLELRAHEPGRARHPEDHPGHEGDRQDRQRAADRLLRLEAEAAGPEREQRAEPDGDRCRRRDARPQGPEEVATLGLHEVGDEDADNERRLEALAQADQVVGEHLGRGAPLPTCRSAPGRMWPRRRCG